MQSVLGVGLGGQHSAVLCGEPIFPRVAEIPQLLSICLTWEVQSRREFL